MGNLKFTIKEAITAATLLVIIGTAYGVNVTSSNANTDKITRVEKRIDRMGKRLRNDIRGNRKLLLKLLRQGE